MTETQMHHFICAFCDNKKCVRGTDKCEFEQWKRKHKTEKMVKNAEEIKEYQIKSNEDILKGFEDFTKMMFKQGRAESEG